MYLNTAKLARGIMTSGSSALRKEGTDFYSYSTKMAKIDFQNGQPALLVNTRKYSSTTSKQMTYLKGYYRKQGFVIIDWDTGEVIG